MKRTFLPVLLAGFVGGAAAQSPAPAPAPVTEPAPAASPAPPSTDEGAATYGPAVPSSVKLPEPKTMEASFSLDQGVILLDVNLSGTRTVKLVFDTGDEANVLDLEVAKEMKVPFDQMLQVPKGKGPDISVQQIQMGDVQMGDATFPARNFLILPVADELKTMGLTCQGTIGYRFFEEKVVQIDYPARKLRLLESMPPAPEGATVLPIRWMPYEKEGRVGVSTVDALKLGDHTVTAQFDTLFGRTLILFTPKLPFLETRRVPDLANAFYAGAVLRPALPAMPMALGDHTFPHPPPAYLADRDARVPETQIAAVLGNVFFLNAVVTLDYKNDKMMVEWREK